MAPSSPGNAESLQAYPNLSTAARILGISASTLSRRDDTAVESRGERDRVLAPKEVLRLAAIFRRRSLNDVAQGLLDHARGSAPEEAARIEEEIEQFFESRTIKDSQRVEFLELAQRLLPPVLAQQVEAVLREPGDDLPDVVRGWIPMASD